MAIKSKCTLFVVMFFFIFASNAFALSAKIFFLDVPNGKSIDKDRDHLILSVEDGWISSRSSLFSRILSNAKGGAIQITSKVTYNDNFTDSKEAFTSLENVKRVMDRPLGLRSTIHSDLPAEIMSLEVILKIAITSEDTIAKVLDGLEKGKDGFSSALLTSQYIGYSKAISVITQSLFGTNASNYPFFARIDLNQNELVKERYILMVSPNRDGDPDLRAAKMSDFSVQDQRVLFKGNPPNWSYVLMKLSKTAKSDIKRKAIGSEAPWATVIRTQLNIIPAGRAKDESQLASVADNALTALKNLENFLTTDRNFSNFDRAEAIYYYTDSTISTIEKACKNGHISQCPVDELGQYRAKIADIYGVGQSDIKLAATAMRLRDIVDIAVASGGTSEDLGKIVVDAQTGEPFNPSTSEWESYLRTSKSAVAYGPLDKASVDKTYQNFFDNKASIQ